MIASGDIVSINTYKNRYTATKYWLDYLHTPTAKSKLTRFIKQQEREIYIKKGIVLVESKLVKYDLPLISNDKDKIKKYYGDQFEHTMMQVASKAISVMTILKDVYAFVPETTKPQKVSDQLSQADDRATVLIDDSSLFEYELCPQCHPQQGEKIIARSGKDGFKIHALYCRALHTVSLDKLIKATWSTKDPELYHFHIVLTIEKGKINLITLLATLQDLGIAIKAVNIDRSDTDGYSIAIQFSHENPSKIAYVIRYIQKHYADVTSLKKKIS